MKVYQLRRILDDYDDNAEVVIPDGDNMYQYTNANCDFVSLGDIGQMVMRRVNSNANDAVEVLVIH